MEDEAMRSVRKLSLEESEEEEMQLQQLHDQMTGPITKLPMDITIEILSRLPTKSLSECRWVSKPWCNLISHPRFILAQHTKAIKTTPSLFLKSERKCILINHQDMADHLTDQQDNLDFYRRSETIDFTETLIPSHHVLNINQNGYWKIRASCDGLLWFRDSKHRDFIINPITRQKISLPQCPKSNKAHFVRGFGFDPKTNDFKLVQMSTERPPFEAYVYTLGSDSSWRKVANVPYAIQGTCWEMGTCFDGALHWLGYKERDSPLLIVSFNLATEKFVEIPLPSGILHVRIFSTHYYSYLRVLEGHFYFMDASGKKRTEIWVMKEFGVQASWAREGFIRHWGAVQEGTTFLKFMHRGEILLQYHQSSLIYYHPIKRESRPIAIETIPHLHNPIILLHVESLISPQNIAGLKKRAVASHCDKSNTRNHSCST